MPNGFAQERDDLFVKARAEVKPAKLGSYGIHGDAQRELFLKVEEAKEFAKAVKADDAEIPLFLWNNGLRPQESRRREETPHWTHFESWALRGLCGD